MRMGMTVVLVTLGAATAVPVGLAVRGARFVRCRRGRPARQHQRGEQAETAHVTKWKSTLTSAAEACRSRKAWRWERARAFTLAVTEQGGKYSVSYELRPLGL